MSGGKVLVEQEGCGLNPQGRERERPLILRDRIARRLFLETRRLIKLSGQTRPFKSIPNLGRFSHKARYKYECSVSFMLQEFD